jgi:hypothetical protein
MLLIVPAAGTINNSPICPYCFPNMSLGVSNAFYKGVIVI